MTFNLVDWWLHDKEYSKDDLEFLNDFCCAEKITSPESDWFCLEERLREYIPMGFSLNYHNLYVHETASHFIDYLFDKYVDEDTLVITSVVEHETVEKNILRLKDKGIIPIKMHYYNGLKTGNLSQVIQEVQNKKYKKAFVYIIGTQITTGETTPHEFYVKLKDYLRNNGLEAVMIIDDVHGMYLHPRDYSIFDYVICTSHALIRRWDMGLMWSKTRETFGYQWGNCLKGYIHRLRMILDRQDKLATFSTVMRETFFDKLNIPCVEYIADSVPHIFSIKVNMPPRFVYNDKDWKELADLEVRLETQNKDKDNIFYIRMRASQYVTFPELLKPAINKVNDILDRVELNTTLTNGE